MADTSKRSDAGNEPASRALASHISKAASEPVSESEAEEAKRALLDCLSACLLGSKEPSYDDYAAVLLGAEAERDEATVISREPKRTNARAAAEMNAATSHKVELAPAVSRAVLHLNGIVFAALATAERLGRSGEELLRAVVLGSEVAIRVGRAVNTDPDYDYETLGDNPLAFRRGWWTPAVLTSIGAAAASGVLLRLSADAMHDGLGLGLASAPTVPTDLVLEGATGRGLPMAMATSAGIMAAELARRGVVGLRDPGTSWARLIGSVFDLAKLTSGLPDSHEFRYLLYKPFATVGPVFAPIEAALAIADEEPVDPAAVGEVVIHCYGRTQAFFRGELPQSAEAARADLAYCVAHALVRRDRGAFLEDAFRPEEFRDTTITGVANKVTTVFTEAYEAEYPLRSAKCRIEVHFRDGRSRQAERDREVLAEYHRPSRSDIESKFLRASDGCIGKERAAAFVEGVWSLEAFDDVRYLLATLSA